MAQTLKPTPAPEWERSWVRRRFQRKGLGFGRGLIVAIPASVLLWLAIAFGVFGS